MTNPEGQRYNDGESWENKGLRLAKKIKDSLDPSLRVAGSAVVARVGDVNVQYLRIDLGPKMNYGIALTQRIKEPIPSLTILLHGGRSPIQNIDDHAAVNLEVERLSDNRIARSFPLGQASRDLFMIHPPEGWILGRKRGLEDVQKLLEQGNIEPYRSVDEYEATIAEWLEIPGMDMR